jgi:F-type H+-transporting ATPase subunit epsilon
MHLKVLLPSAVFADVQDVSSIVAESHHGSFGLLPHRRDCVAALAPGILRYVVGAGAASYLAIDAGVLTKTGAEVLIAVRRAIRGANLGELHDEVTRQYRAIDQKERELRAAIGRMDGAFIAHVAGLEHGR